jgi:hypothetical protein
MKRNELFSSSKIKWKMTRHLKFLLHLLTYFFFIGMIIKKNKKYNLLMLAICLEKTRICWAWGCFAYCLKKKTFPKQQRTTHPFPRLPVCRKTSLTTGLVFRRGPHSAIAHPIRLYSRFLPLFFKKKKERKEIIILTGCSLAALWRIYT